MGVARFATRTAVEATDVLFGVRIEKFATPIVA
jgi:hypothetical protein